MFFGVVWVLCFAFVCLCGKACGLRSSKKRLGYRRARACPSPCRDRRGDIAIKIGTGRSLLLTDDREGQALALRLKWRFLQGMIAGETLSDARVASEGPRATVKKRLPRCRTKNAWVTVGRGPVPRHRSCTRPLSAPSLDLIFKSTATGRDKS